MARVAATGRVAATSRVAIPMQENMLLDNQNLTGANWVVTNTTVAGGKTDPMGGTGAFELTETAVNDFHVIRPAAGLSFDGQGTQGFWFCASIWLQSGSRTFGGWFCDFGAGTLQALWNLNTGASTTFTATGTVEDSFVRNVVPPLGGGGWGLYEVAGYFRNASNGSFAQVAMSSDGASFSYLGVAGRTVRVFAPSVTFANQRGRETNSNGAAITTRIRNRARGRVAP